MTASPSSHGDHQRVRGLGTALVTGATAGIGFRFAEELAARGHDLVLVARDTDRLSEVAADLAERFAVRTEVLAADLTDRAAVDRVAARIGDADDPVELLVNNAGFGLKKRFEAADLEDEQAQLDVLVVAVMRLSHAALRAMLPHKRGGILNVSSVAAFLDGGTYSAAKAWVNSFSRWAAAEYAGDGVHVMALCPGYVRTEFHQRMGVRQSAPDFLWLEATGLVHDALDDFDAGKVVSVPSLRYKAITTAARVVPAGLQRRLTGRRAR
ncbi:MAG: SDR family oxidoreductase [Nocardioides sp.]|jgi:short-subunit dehydrogenase